MAENKISAPESSGGAVAKLKNNVSQTTGLLYGLGFMMFSGFNQMLTSYWNFFLTNAVGLDPAVMGSITSLSSMAAWVFVFIAAMVVEKVWFRWGQYRSYLLIAPPLAFVFILGAWTDWTWMPGITTGSGAQIALIGGCYILGQFFINLFMISGTSIISAVSRTEADRSLMSTRKAQGNMAIKVLFAAVSLPMIIFFAGGDFAAGTRPDVPIGYTITAFIWGIIFVGAFVGLFMLFKGKDPTEEYCQAKAAAKKRGEKFKEIETGTTEKVSIVESLKFFFTNVPALGLWLGEVARAVCTMVLNGMAIYFCTVVYNDNTLYAGMLTAANICGLIATFAGEACAKTIGNRWTYLLGTGIAAAAMLAGFFVASSYWPFIICVCASFFGTNMMMSVEFSCMSNAIAYQEWKKGKTSKAFIMGTIQWCPNIGKILQGALVGFGLGAIGYSKENTVAPPEMVTGIAFLTFMVPAIELIVCFVLFFFMHRLDAKQMAVINADLDKRHKEDEAKIAASLKNEVALDAAAQETED